VHFGYINELRKTEWEKLVSQNPASGFMQSFFWTRFTNLLAWPTYKIGVFDNKSLFGGAIIIKFATDNGNNYLYIPEGPVLPYATPGADKIFDGLIAEIDKVADLTGNSLTSHVRIDPKLTQLPAFFKRFQKAPTNPEPLRTLLIDLSLSKDELLAKMKPIHCQ